MVVLQTAEILGLIISVAIHFLCVDLVLVCKVREESAISELWWVYGGKVIPGRREMMEGHKVTASELSVGRVSSGMGGVYMCCGGRTCVPVSLSSSGTRVSRGWVCSHNTHPPTHPPTHSPPSPPRPAAAEGPPGHECVCAVGGSPWPLAGAPAGLQAKLGPAWPGTTLRPAQHTSDTNRPHHCGRGPRQSPGSARVGLHTGWRWPWGSCHFRR